MQKYLSFCNSSWPENSSIRRKLALLQSCWISPLIQIQKNQTPEKGIGLSTRFPSGEQRDTLHNKERKQWMPRKLGGME